MNAAYRIALFCGATPLAASALLFLLWIATKWNGLISAGVVIIYSGLALLAIGAMALLCYGWLAFRQRDLPRKKIWGAIASATALLCAQFPVAWGTAGAIVAIGTRYTVLVRNDSAQPLQHVLIYGPGASAAIFSIPPHASAERSLWFQGDGELRFEATRDNAKINGTIAPRVTREQTGRAEVLVNAAGQMTVKPSPPAR